MALACVSQGFSVIFNPLHPLHHVSTKYIEPSRRAYCSRVLEYQGKTENILENIFCIETVWRPKIFDILHYSTKISCQVHLKHVF